MQKLLVKLPNWMGDILFSYDLLNSLATSLEEMAVLTSTNHRQLFEIFPLPRTRVIAYPPESWPRFDPETVKAIEDFRADAVLVLPNSIGAALILRFFARAPLYGYATEHRDFLMRKSMLPPVARIHQAAYYLQLLQLFDLEARSYPPDGATSGQRRVVIHPGASKMERAWHMDRFLEIGHQISEEGYQVVFVSGTRMASEPFEAVVNPSLKEFVDLLKGSALFIGNDSGPLHLAQQAGIPVVGIYGPGNPLTTGPRPMTPHRVVYHAFPCSPCRQKFFQECAPSTNGKPFCLETIGVNEVRRAALELLNPNLQPV